MPSVSSLGTEARFCFDEVPGVVVFCLLLAVAGVFCLMALLGVVFAAGDLAGGAEAGAAAACNLVFLLGVGASSVGSAAAEVKKDAQFQKCYKQLMRR